MISLFVVIGFILTFEFFTGLLEYILEEAPLYSKMVQKIYKELMQMGIVSFLILLYTASGGSSEIPEVDSSHSSVNGSSEAGGESPGTGVGAPHQYAFRRLSSSQQNSANGQWLLAIDFAHVLLFFVAFFFVSQALYLMAVSINTSQSYIRLFHLSDGDLFSRVSNLNSGDRHFFGLRYLPFSRLRGKVEFRLIYALFRDTHRGLPKNFVFPLYLKKCFERYSLKTIDIGAFSWCVVASLAAGNCARIYFHGAFNCGPNEAKYARVQGARRLAGEIATVFFTGNEANEDMRHLLTHRLEQPFHSSSVMNPFAQINFTSIYGSAKVQCRFKQLQLFFVCAIFLCVYIVILLISSRVYFLR